MSANGDDHALSDVTNKVAKVQVSEVALECVKQAGWVPTQGFDYGKYNKGPHDKTAPASGPDQPQGDASGWAGDAVRYEWDEDYGDVGPEHKELKDILFSNENKMVRGEEFSK